MNAQTTPAYPIITVRRPNGDVEAVSVASKLLFLDDALFAQIQAATKAAGRGDVLSYENAPARTKPMFKSMGPGWCNRCESYCYGDCRANG